MIQLLICLVIKSFNLIVTELFIRGRKLNISLAFITQSYFAMPKNIWQINISTNINKLHLIARQILNLLIFTKNALQNYMFFF